MSTPSFLSRHQGGDLLSAMPLQVGVRAMRNEEDICTSDVQTGLAISEL
jgi:hypothetical protein